MYETVGYIRIPRKSASAESAEISGGFVCKSESMTDQQFTRASKITSVLERYKRTGLMPHRVKPPIPFESQTRPDLNDYQAVFEAKEVLLNLVESESAVPDRASAGDPNGATVAPAAEETVSDGTDAPANP